MHCLEFRWVQFCELKFENGDIIPDVGSYFVDDEESDKDD
jgi:hypothetical protein